MNRWNMAILILAAAGMTAYYITRSGGSHEVPAFFDTSLTYAGALERSTATGKPVLAMVSADWCGPCRVFKRNALADPRVAAWITANTIPVYLDASTSSSPGAGPAARLGARGIPAIFLVRDGEPFARHEGVLDAERFLDWLETVSGPPATPAG